MVSLPFQLHQATDPAWIDLALKNFDRVLVDHAHCEKKAAANALSFLQNYPDVPGLPAHMARLAREESAHLAKVLELLELRGLALGHDRGDPYVQALQKHVRTPYAERRMDRLLVAALVEARSCERLALLSDGLADEPLKRFYRELAQSESGHQTLFVRLAEAAHDVVEVRRRLDTLLQAEADMIRNLPLRAAIH